MRDDSRFGKGERAGWFAALGYAWVVMIVLGAIVLETLMVYPNVFHDPPASLELAMDFLAVRGPSDVFPPLGFTSWVLGAAAVVLCWRRRDARWWLVLSVAAIVAEGVASVVYFWPRNEVMFVEGLAQHSPEHLADVAREFETWHWLSRMVFNTVAAVAAFVGFLRVDRARFLARAVARGGGS
ncbi:DUF1772 domain-containing protein [Cellulosimicrobium marinum]|uniref:DUF1772 domain-containing protein n=1 Tax=Cellulosimicrobium marinum TaxID=1638992 RepID=UPI001E43A35B|nr:DUF1772 domain-containing protein [Cellulosimicrobium marinum]MCB7137459.1 DUF1772 domain-containing protein [Cellulosimicrobium marinum]